MGGTLAKFKSENEVRALEVHSRELESVRSSDCIYFFGALRLTSSKIINFAGRCFSPRLRFGLHHYISLGNQQMCMRTDVFSGYMGDETPILLGKYVKVQQRTKNDVVNVEEGVFWFGHAYCGLSLANMYKSMRLEAIRIGVVEWAAVPQYSNRGNVVALLSVEAFEKGVLTPTVIRDFADRLRVHVAPPPRLESANLALAVFGLDDSENEDEIVRVTDTEKMYYLEGVFDSSLHEKDNSNPRREVIRVLGLDIDEGEKTLLRSNLIWWHNRYAGRTVTPEACLEGDILLRRAFNAELKFRRRAAMRRPY